MDSKSMWRAYCREAGVDERTKCDAWAFGDDPDGLGQLVLRGVKTATCSAMEIYALEGEALPQAGEYSVVEDGQGNALCVIRTTRVQIMPMNRVGAEHAWKEGEGDRSLEHWRQVHERFMREDLAQSGLAYRDDLPLVLEEFEVVYPIAGGVTMD